MARRRGSWSLQLETLIGGRTISSAAALPRTDSCTSPDGDGCAVFSSELALEPRLGVVRWLNPWLTITGWAGSDVLDHHVRAAGLALGVHTLGYDGD